MSGKRRNSSIELMRLVAIFSIVIGHYCIYGGKLATPCSRIASDVIAAGESWGYWGVDLFILITGYFLSSNNDTKKLVLYLVRFYVQVWTTSVICLLLYFLYYRPELDVGLVIESIFPIGYGIWWFATYYFTLVLFSPFLNVMLSHLSKKQHTVLIFLMLSLWSFSIVLPKSKFGYSYIESFVMLYVIGAYIRKYYEEGCKHKYLCILVAVLLLLMPASIFSLQYVVSWVPSLPKNYYYFVSERSPLTISAAVATFLFVLSKKTFHSTLVNRIATTTFGIYLFTDNPLTRYVIWKDLVKTEAQFESDATILLMFISTCLVIAVAIAVEMMRQKFIQRPVIKILTKYGEKVLGDVR